MAVLITNSTSDVSEEVNYQLMRGLLSAARKRLPYFNGTLPGELMGKGSTRSVMWERIENLTPVTSAIAEPTGNLAYLNGRALVQPTKSTVNATAAKYGNAIGLTEEVDLLQMNVNSMKLMETLGANAGESLNELMIDTFQTVTTSTALRHAAGVASAGAIVTAISANDVKWAVNHVNRNSGQKFTPMGTGSQNYNSQPIRDAYFGICHPDVEEDLRGLGSTTFIGVEQYAGYTQTVPGEIGTVGGVRFCVSELSGAVDVTGIGGATSAASLRYTVSAGVCDVYDTFIYGKEAVGTISLNATHAANIYKMYDQTPNPIQLIHQPLGSGGVGDPFKEQSTIAWKCWFAAAILNNTWISRLRTGATDLS